MISSDLYLFSHRSSRISKFLPKLLGKTFHKKRKLPINVKLDGAPSLVAKSLKKAFDSVHGLITGKGSSTRSVTTKLITVVQKTGLSFGCISTWKTYHLFSNNNNTSISEPCILVYKSVYRIQIITNL